MLKEIYKYNHIDNSAKIVISPELHKYCSVCGKRVNLCKCKDIKEREIDDQAVHQSGAGVTFDDEKRVLSIYTEGYSWFVPRQTYNCTFDDKLIKRKWRNEISWSQKTGEISFNAVHGTIKDETTTKSNPIKAGFLYTPAKHFKSHYYYDTGRPAETTEAAKLFVNELLSITGIPKRMFAPDWTYDDVNNIIGEALCIANAPNTVIKKTQTRCRMRTDDPVNRIMAMNRSRKKDIKAFRELQPRQVMDEEEYIDYMIKAVGAPISEGLLKMYRTNPMYIGWAGYAYNKLHIESVTEIKKKVTELFAEASEDAA